MNCDDVFEVLTRGPFPSGAPGEDEVEAHLARCFDCQRLAEALRPAVELFQEAVEPDECFGLPGYHGPATWYEEMGSAARGEQTPLESVLPNFLARERRRRDEPVVNEPAPLWWRLRSMFAVRDIGDERVLTAYGPRRLVVQCAAAVLLGIAVALGVIGLSAKHDAFSDSADPARAAGLSAGMPRRGESAADRNWLLSLGVPANCMPRHPDWAVPATADDEPHAVRVAAVDEAILRQDCCTECHNTESPGLLTFEAQSRYVRACRACH